MANVAGPNLREQCSRRPPVPIAEEHEPFCAGGHFINMSFLKPELPDFPEEPLREGILCVTQKVVSRPLIEGEDDFEALITFPDGAFERVTSTSTSNSSSLTGAMDTVESSWESASWHHDLPPGTVIPPDRRLHERHVQKLNRFMHNVDIAPLAFSGMVRKRRAE
ncbi:unnamed protein product [Symbiodinium natans]|uniref:Uncharacterized protein n=1 Tax=Symbiodinium natans TaxID=878477 RepID=A0A812KZN8_9DINO|nr:unnamed protein product [Symbiodinium natans]